MIFIFERLATRLGLPPSPSVAGRAAMLAVSLILGCAATAAEAARYIVLTSGEQSGSMSVTPTGPERRITFSFNDRGRGPEIQSVVVLDSALSPTRMSVDGSNYYKLPVSERFERKGSESTWKATNDQGRWTRPGFYFPDEAAPEHFAMLVRAALRSPGQRIRLLPSGEARIELAARRQMPGPAGEARLYLIHGLGLEPVPIWLDRDGELLMEGSAWFTTVRDDVRQVHQALLNAQTAAMEAVDLKRGPVLMRRPKAPIAFRDVSVFDSERRTIVPGMTVIVRGNRIEALGPAAKVAVPDGAQVIDGRGRTLLPGLWDMHTHVSSNAQGLMHLAAGVTSVRDLANLREEAMARSARFEALELAGPRMSLAGFIDGPGPNAGPVKVLAATPAELRSAIQDYAAHGYRQIKLYSSLDPALVPVAAEETRRLGMRLSGHVPSGMRMRQAVEAGFDEVHHLNFMALNFMSDEINAKTSGIARITAIAEQAGEIDPQSATVAEFVSFLRSHGTVVDPTVSLYENHLTGRPGRVDPVLAPILERLPPVIQRAARGSGLARSDAEVERNAGAFRTMLGLLKRLHEGGVTIVAGSDGIPGFTLLRELELYQQAGIPPLDVLHIATLGAARVAGRDADLGSIAVGKLADLILVAGAPGERLSHLRRLDLVVRDGVPLEPDQLLQEAGFAPAE